MAKFFKTFAKGILYVLALPLLVVFLAIYFIISLISFIVLSIQGIILFFKGENLVGELEEDKLAKERLEALNNPLQNNIQVNPTINQIKQDEVTNDKEEEVSIILNDIDHQNIQSEEEIFTPLEEPEPEEEIDNNTFEEINISRDHTYDREEYIIDEPIDKKEENDSVDFFDYDGGEE